MKKILLLLGLGALVSLINAQTVFNVDSPSSIEGGYDFTYAVSTSGWGVADLTDPANSVVDTIAVVDDGTAADSLGCGPLTNGSDINGKIAVVYRGTCEFGEKAFNAQNEGAVAVIIINNIAGDPIGMSGGTYGGQVTIPVVMVSDIVGADLVNAATTEDVIVFIGNKLGRFGNDLAIDPNEVIRPKYTAVLGALSQNASELAMQVGGWVRNYGINTQYNLNLTCDISFGGNSIYNSSESVDSLGSGDSVLIALPTFSQASYLQGEYEMIYTLTSDSTDDYDGDNMQSSKMLINDTYISRGTVDPATGLPSTPADNYYWFAKSCVSFSDANASRIGVRSLTFSATSTRNDDLFEKYLEIAAYEWDGQTVASMDQISRADYDYNSTDMNEVNVTVEFPKAFQLVDNQNYLFCVENSTSDTVYISTTEIGYGQTITAYNEYTAMFESATTAGSTSFFSDIVPAISIETLPGDAVSVEEAKENKELKAYPNPARDLIAIPVGNIDVTTVTIFDISGKIVASQNVSVVDNRLTLDVTSITNGAYVVMLNYADNTTSKINIVISK